MKTEIGERVNVKPDWTGWMSAVARESKDEQKDRLEMISRCRSEILVTESRAE